jgi:hypothetical protein
MGNRITVIFTDGNSVSKTGLYYHWGGSVVGITIEEVYGKIQKVSNLDRSPLILRSSDERRGKKSFTGSMFIPEILNLEEDEMKNPRLLNCGDNGVVVVNIKDGTLKNLRGNRWARTYSIKEYADKCRRSVG